MDDDTTEDVKRDKTSSQLSEVSGKPEREMYYASSTAEYTVEAL
jgi:hypothetical protein